VGSYFLGPLFFLNSPGDHSLDLSRIAEDGLGDNNHVAADLGVDSPNNSRACYFFTDSVALTKTESACHSL
jgi:hypothetical protein